jgi:hypothetical protein
MTRQHTLDRRTFLRGMFGGTALSLALPPMEAMFGHQGQAYASTGALPKRFGLFFWGNGIILDQWTPANTGRDWTLSPLLEPLADVRDDVTLVTGYEVKVPNVIAHRSGPAGLFSGHASLLRGEDDTFAGPTLDQIIASELGGDTLFRSLELSVGSTTSGLSHNGPDSINPPEWDPAKVFDRLFGVHFRAPGDEPLIDPKLAVRRSVLDAVMQDATRLKRRLGQVDKTRLDQHMESVRNLELRVARMQEDPPSLAACIRPEEPLALPDIEGREQLSERARLMADLTAMAFACDQTRVASLWYSDPFNDLLFPTAHAGHHQLTHDEPGDQPQVQAIVRQIVSDYAYLVDKLRSIPEGDGTLLDNCAILGTTDCSQGRTHQLDEYPILIAGRAGGALQTGFHHRSETKDNASKVSLSLLRAMGVPATSFGSEDAYTTDVISEIEA